MAKPGESESETSDVYLKGTTFRVYRYLIKKARPATISEIQKALGLSSPSVSQYHIRKLVAMNLVREEQAGYVINRMVLENFIRIRRISIPLQTAYAAFFGATLVILASLLRPRVIDSLYLFAFAINLAALSVSLYEAAKTFKRL